jgi:hypothetical protein
MVLGGHHGGHVGGLAILRRIALQDGGAQVIDRAGGRQS